MDPAATILLIISLSFCLYFWIKYSTYKEQHEKLTSTLFWSDFDKKQLQENYDKLFEANEALHKLFDNYTNKTLSWSDQTTAKTEELLTKGYNNDLLILDLKLRLGDSQTAIEAFGENYALLKIAFLESKKGFNAPDILLAKIKEMQFMYTTGAIPATEYFNAINKMVDYFDA
jgi:hypothetical protein